MRASKNLSRAIFPGALRRAASLLAALALVSQSLFVAASAQASQTKAQADKLGEEQRIVHVLNRLGFGARPGDVERVKAMGLDNYINQQLNPEKSPTRLRRTKSAI